MSVASAPTRPWPLTPTKEFASCVMAVTALTWMGAFSKVNFGTLDVENNAGAAILQTWRSPDHLRWSGGWRRESVSGQRRGHRHLPGRARRSSSAKTPSAGNGDLGYRFWVAPSCLPERARCRTELSMLRSSKAMPRSPMRTARAISMSRRAAPVAKRRSSGRTCSSTGCPKQKSKSDRIPSVTIASVLARHGIDRCDFIQIDAEGYDYQIVRRSTSKSRSRSS